MAMIGIIAAVAVPALRTGRGDDAGSVARALAAALRDARNAAAERGRTVAFHLDARTGEYAVVTVPAPFEAPDTVGIGRIPLGGGAATVRCGRARCVVTFDPVRRVRGAPIEVVDDEQRYEVTTDAWNANVRVRPR